MDISDNIICKVWLHEDKDTKFSDGSLEVMSTSASVKENVGKRSRSTNFTPDEKMALVNLVDQYKEVIEYKKTDFLTQKRKKAVWEQIARKFNAQNGVCLRSTASLRKLYDNKIRAELRQKGAKVKERLEAFRSRDVTLDDPLSLEESNKESLDDVEDDVKPIIEIEYVEPAMPLCTELPLLTGPGASGCHEHVILDCPKELIDEPDDPKPSHTPKTLENPESKSIDRKRPRATPYTTNHLAKQYDELVKRKLAAANLKIKRYNNELRYQTEEAELRKQALLLDLEIKKKTLEKLND